LAKVVSCLVEYNSLRNINKNKTINTISIELQKLNNSSIVMDSNTTDRKVSIA